MPILGGFKGRLHATVDVVYFLYAILGGFKGRLHATVDVVYFVYAFIVKTINILCKKRNKKHDMTKKINSGIKKN